MFLLKNIQLPSNLLNLYLSNITIALNFFFLNFTLRKYTNLVDILIKFPKFAIFFFFFWYIWKQLTVIIPELSEVLSIDDFCINIK